MKVLFCTDGSEASLYAIKKTLPFIKSDYQIDIVYVIDKKFLSHIAAENKEKVLVSHQNAAHEILDKTTEFITSRDYKVTNSYCLKGHPSTEIIDLSKSENHNIIALGSHGKSGIENWLGSTSREVIMNALCPVLVARPPKKAHIFNKDVLVTVNNSECSSNAIKKMIETLDLQNASIEILTVTYGSESIPSELVMDEHWLKEFMAKERERAAKILDKSKKIFEENNIPVKSTFHLEGFVSKEILDYLEENPKDLVVMGTHGRDEITSFLLGSVSKRVLDHATSPVLIIPNKKRPED